MPKIIIGRIRGFKEIAMIDERRRSGSESKKVDGGGNCLRNMQRPRTFSKIRTQTFTRLKSAFFFSIKRASKIIENVLFDSAVLTGLTALFLRFLLKIKSVLFSQNRGLKLKNSGYVLILIAAFIPVLLFGTKYVLDQMTANQVEIEQVKGELAVYYKKCAQEAALAVAKNWNPGLNLSYQKNALMKVADAVYNDAPCYIKGDTSIYNAIPGLDMKGKPQVTQPGGKFGPIKVTYSTDQMTTQSAVMSTKEIKYTDATKYLLRYYRGYYTTAYDGTGGGYENVYHRVWRETDLNTQPEYRYSYFDEIDETKRKNQQYELIHQDIYTLPCRANPTDLLARKNAQGQLLYPNNSFFWPGCSANHNQFYITIPSTSTSVTQYYPWKYHTNNTVAANYTTVSTTTYKTRTTPSGTDPVTITIDNDRIKVTTDSSTGAPGTVAYAKPAELNVDIVLAVPVNGAASNANNNDTASTTAEYPATANEATQTSSFSSSTTGTPIYQMGQALKKFVKDNFYHIRGVTMGLIPYSGKVSVSPDKTSYTLTIPQFTEKTKWTNPYHVTAAMYGTRGEAGAALVNSYVWNTILTGCPIMCRRGSTTTYNSSTVFYGNLLSNAKPSDGDQYKYMRMNLNPCLAGYANQLSMKCERKCTNYFPNPYYMIEPTADLVKIYEMCNALFPVYDPNNVSNFLFIPFEWANNFWQSWTSDVTASAGTDTLSRPSKTTSGRKKVLVMLVNKPDWFEPGEMTYLGFDNDYSFVPLAESDKIDFSIDYSSSSGKKFLDGTSYDGTPRGPKKIIRYSTYSGTIARNSSGDFECTGNGTGRLYIPRQAMVRLTVKNRSGGGNLSSGNVNWTYYSQALNPSGYSSCTNWGNFDYPSLIAYKSGRFAIVQQGGGGVTAYSDNGINWYRGNNHSGTYAFAANDSYFVGIWNGKNIYSSDGIDWNSQSVSTPTAWFWQDLSWNGSKFFTVHGGTSNLYTTTSINGTGTWVQDGSSTQIETGYYERFKYGGGYYVKKGVGTSNILRSSTSINFSSYNSYTIPWSRVSALNYGSGYWLILTQYGDLLKSTDASATNWSIIDGSASDTTSSSLYSKSGGKTNWFGICYGGGKWVAYTKSGDVAVLECGSGGGSNDPGTIKFTNIGDTTTFTIKDEKTFTIPASNITSTSGDEYYVEFNVSNLKLISAEVTNLDYAYVSPINASYSEVEMIGPSGSSENLSWGTRTKTMGPYSYSSLGSYSSISTGSGNEQFSMTRGSGISYSSSNGWYTANKDTDYTITIYSPINSAMSLGVSSYKPNESSGGGSGTITFYDTNIGSGSFTKDGSSASFNTAYTVNSSGSTFVFSGGTTPSPGTGSSFYHSQGPNFYHNLSVKKVRYYLSDTNKVQITNCVLKNQILREYMGIYSGNKTLILNNGSTSGSFSSNPGLFKDSCIVYVSGGTISGNVYRYGPDYGLGTCSSLGQIQDHYGVAIPFKVSYSKHDCGTGLVYYKSGNGYDFGGNPCISGNSYTGHWDWYDTVFFNDSRYSDRVRLVFNDQNAGCERGYHSQSYGHLLVNYSTTKNLYSPSTINSNPFSYTDLITYNKYVYLFYYGGEYWICFQGDGQLEVTVKGGSGETYNTPYLRVNSATNNSLTSSISTSDWLQDGERYKVTLHLKNAKLTSVNQSSQTINYPTLFGNSNYSVTYSYNDSSGTRQVKTGTLASPDSNSSDKYFIQLPRNSTPKFAARKYSVTETVYDMIDFTANTTSSKNGCLSSSFSDSYGSGFYYVGSSSVNRTLTTSRKGRLELKVAPSFYADSGYIKMNYGSDTTAKTITAPTTLSMKYSDLSSGTMQFTLYNCVILYAKLCDAEATIGSPNYSSSQNLMWNSSSVSTSGTNISLSGTYSNYSADWGWHRLTTNSFLTWNNSYCSDITSVMDATSPIFAYWYMPQNVYTDYANTNLVGPMRLFAPITRDSTFTPRKYCQMYAYNSNYTNKANLLWHNFTLPCNHVLYRAGYQSAGGDATIAVRNATAAVCAKLKTDYGSNLRVYVVKYRKQDKYKTFPMYNASQSNANHDYSVIDACATSSSYVYDISAESDLKTTLNNIASDIKSFAGGVKAAENVN